MDTLPTTDEIPELSHEQILALVQRGRAERAEFVARSLRRLAARLAAVLRTSPDRPVAAARLRHP